MPGPRARGCRCGPDTDGGEERGKEGGSSEGGRPPVAGAKATPQRPRRGQNVGDRRGPAGRGRARGKAAARAGLGAGAAAPSRARPAHCGILPQVRRAAGSPQALAGPGALSGAWLAKEEQYK